MRYQDENSKLKKNHNYFLDGNFSITIACTQSKFDVFILATYMGGTVSQIYYLGLSFYFMPKIGKHLKKVMVIIFEST